MPVSHSCRANFMLTVCVGYLIFWPNAALDIEASDDASFLLQASVRTQRRKNGSAPHYSYGADGGLQQHGAGLSIEGHHSVYSALGAVTLTAQKLGFFTKLQPGFLNYGTETATLSSCAKDNHDPADPLDSVGLRANLYSTLADLAESGLKDKMVLEVGSGRGAGAKLLSSCHCPKSYVGLDFDPTHVEISRQRPTNASCPLSFVQGNAMKLPFDNESVDVIMNVESSHCYEDYEAFVNEASRVLRPGGIFLTTDFRVKDDMPSTRAALRQAFPGGNMTEIDISQNVIKSIDTMNPEADRICSPLLWWVPEHRNVCREFVGAKGSWLDVGLRSSEVEYYQIRMEKA